MFLSHHCADTLASLHFCVSDAHSRGRTVLSAALCLNCTSTWAVGGQQSLLGSPQAWAVPPALQEFKGPLFGFLFPTTAMLALFHSTSLPCHHPAAIIYLLSLCRHEFLNFSAQRNCTQTLRGSDLVWGGGFETCNFNKQSRKILIYTVRHLLSLEGYPKPQALWEQTSCLIWFSF